MPELTRAVGELLPRIRSLIASARDAAARTVNSLQVLTNFEIGRLIVEHQQEGAERAVYGKALLKKLAASLTEEFGRGFSRSNLEYMRRFFLSFQERRPAISQTPSGILPVAQKSQKPSGMSEHTGVSQTTFANFTLSWSHYVFLISIENPDDGVMRRDTRLSPGDRVVPEYLLPWPEAPSRRPPERTPPPAQEPAGRRRSQQLHSPG